MIVKLCQYFHSIFGMLNKKGAAFLCAAPKPFQCFVKNPLRKTGIILYFPQIQRPPDPDCGANPLRAKPPGFRTKSGNILPKAPLSLTQEKSFLLNFSGF